MRDWMRTKIGAIKRNSLHAKLARIERESHGSRATYVGNNRVLVKCVAAGANIAYYVEADDKLLSPWFIITGQYEIEPTNFFLREIRHDSHCIDVGSNFGYFTCLLARFCPEGKVIGVEADRHVYELVRDNIAINGFAHAQAVHAAAGDSDGEVTLFRRHSRSGNTSIIAADRGFTDLLGEEPAQPFTVRCVRIDDLADSIGGRVDLMKIDVEGSEPLAIAGAERTIAANPGLSIVMEWSPGQIQGAGFDVGDFLRVLEAKGLRAFELTRDAIVPLPYERLATLSYRSGIVLRR
ncbi:FkbM family methyltransferase [Sphingomonas sp.]|uniref:FkbM family methyltransferase n=1 Tax=Sphingomonas sp. TaxID=28214 RepID=UPI003B007525